MGADGVLPSAHSDLLEDFVDVHLHLAEGLQAADISAFRTNQRADHSSAGEIDTATDRQIHCFLLQEGFNVCRGRVDLVLRTVELQDTGLAQMSKQQCAHVP